MCWCIFRRLIRSIFALNCLLQIEQVNSENDNSDDDPLALALRFLFASQILYIISFWYSNVLYISQVLKVGKNVIFIPNSSKFRPNKCLFNKYT